MKTFIYEFLLTLFGPIIILTALDPKRNGHKVVSSTFLSNVKQPAKCQILAIYLTQLIYWVDNCQTQVRNCK